MPHFLCIHLVHRPNRVIRNIPLSILVLPRWSCEIRNVSPFYPESHSRVHRHNAKYAPPGARRCPDLACRSNQCANCTVGGAASSVFVSYVTWLERLGLFLVGSRILYSNFTTQMLKFYGCKMMVQNPASILNQLTSLVRFSQMLLKHAINLPHSV